MTAMLPAHLSESLNNLGDAALKLTEEVRDDRATRRRRDRVMLALLVVLSLLVVGIATLGVTNRRTNAQNAEILRQTARTSELIADCTTEGGVCYRKGQARAGSAVQGAIRGYIVVTQCARVTDTDAELERCVERKLAAASKPTPAPSPSPSR